MVNISCSVANCGFETGEVSEALAIAVLNNHALAHQHPAAAAAAGPKLERPKVDVGISEEDWNVFIRRWEVFRSGSRVSDAAAPWQLFQCAATVLGDSLLKSDPAIATKNVDVVLASMKSLAVIPIAKGVLRADLLQMRQERDESFRAFAARVRGKAETCAFSAQCVCNLAVNYTDHVIRDVLLSGISDYDIRREVLGKDDILATPINDVIALVEHKEMARNAMPSSQSAVSSFKRQSVAKPPTASSLPATGMTTAPRDHDKRISCPECKKLFSIYTQNSCGWNTKPHPMCLECFRVQRRRGSKNTDTPPSSAHATLAATNEPDNPFAQCQQISALSMEQCHQPRLRSVVAPVVLDHLIFSKGEWRRARLRKHPEVVIEACIVTPAGHDKSQHRRPKTTVQVTACADSGAQSDLWSLKQFMESGFSQEDLHPVSMSLSAANKSPIKIAGAFLAELSGKSPNGDVVKSRSMVYVSDSVNTMYLSCETMMNLGIIGRDFPTIGSVRDDKAASEHGQDHPVGYVRAINGGCVGDGRAGAVGSCSCPQRSVAPPLPEKLPFPCVPENNTKMREWLLERYRSSTFNTCPHRPLPCMDGPPLEIHIDPAATPKACHTAASIPVHWQDQVYQDLLRDEALGVIERVPYGEPVEWCHRMVVTRKHDGSPRRTVDLSPLNKFCQRETYATESPFQMARRVPKDSWKTVTDAWNGFHSIPLREEDKKLTSFITPFGRWRYLRGPQGYLSTGDGYNRRFASILTDFPRKERCVDDTIHHDQDLEEHWWRTLEFLTTVGKAGIVLHPAKFQFAQRDVEFAGFRITDSTVEPLPKFYEAIRDFPTPRSTTDIRSWFGLVNQVANYAQLRDMMTPFRPFLSPRCKFSWTAELDAAFEQSKLDIIEAIKRGVEIFDMNRRTCLRPDWSKEGIGFFLQQQHCGCSTGVPGCCTNGWCITLAGSRFLSPTESRYAPVEGEALAVAWGLEQTRYFTQGCDNLVVVTDHKPLVKIFGDRTLDEIHNSRLFRLKQRALPWRFEIRHLPGKTNGAADAASRHPSPVGSINSTACPIGVSDAAEEALMASIQSDVDGVTSLSWTELADATTSDPALARLLHLIQNEFRADGVPIADLAPYWSIRESLYSLDGVLMYQDRVVVPPALRQKVLRSLHSAHQGVSSMELRARTLVYWPGMSGDFQEFRDRCSDCNRNAPSQAAMPPITSSPPSTPFESIFADFFDYAGRHFLVAGDRLSGWIEAFSCPSGTGKAGSTGLISHLRTLFAIFGVPMELSSDGGPEFTAGETKDFLRRWGVQHRISSAHFPQSNGRAEVAVKSMKRLLMSNVGPNGDLNQDRFLRAILQLRNSPDPECGLSPAQILFGRPLRDAFSFANRLEKFSNPHIRPSWRDAWRAKEDALRVRIARSMESLSEHSRPLRPLAIGNRVFLQNQMGGHPNKWDRSGTVMEKGEHDQYLIKVDGSGRLTLRNRRFLRLFTPARTSVSTRADPPSRPPRCHDKDPFLRLPAPTIDRSTAPIPTLDTPVTPQPATHMNGSPSQPGDAPVVPTPIDLTQQQITDTPLPQAAPPVIPPSSPRRTRRSARPPKIYEPESGKWVN